MTTEQPDDKFYGMGKLWQWITYHRHRSELWALGLAMRVPFLAMLPIGFILCFWWLVLVVLPATVLIVIVGQFPGTYLRAVFGILSAIPALAILFLTAPWLFGWYWIGSGLMFGRPKAAAAKEKFLVGAIAAYRADQRSPNPT